MKIALNEQDIYKLVKETVNKFLTEGWGRPKPIHYSYDDKLEFIKDDNIKDGGNFGIKRNGKEYWVSRSNSIALYVYCRNEKNEWCVLANLRGPKTRNGGKWNVVCGFLDYGYSLEDTAVKECWEETGIQINKKMLRNRGTNSSHVNGSVNTTFTTILNGVTTDYILTNKNCEPGEVTDVKWIPISEIKKYNWVGNLGKNAIMFSTELNNGSDSDDILNIKIALNNMLKRKEITISNVNKIIKILNI